MGALFITAILKSKTEKKSKIILMKSASDFINTNS
jgi:hypothetical protein